MVPFSSIQSRFLEALLVRQADGKLKKRNNFRKHKAEFAKISLKPETFMWIWFEKPFFLSCQKTKWQTYQFAICIYKLLTYISTFLIIEEMAFVKQHLEKSTSFYYFCLLKLYFNASSYTKTEGHKEDLRSQMFLYFYFAMGRKQDWRGFQFS